MKIVLNNSTLVFKTSPIEKVTELKNVITTNSVWNASSLKAETTDGYDRSTNRIAVKSQTPFTIVLNGVSQDSIIYIGLLQLDRNGSIVSDLNFNKNNMFTANGASIMLTESTVKVLINIKRQSGVAIDYGSSVIKYFT